MSESKKPVSGMVGSVEGVVSLGNQFLYNKKILV